MPETKKRHHFTQRPEVTGPFEWQEAAPYTDITYHKGVPGTDTEGIARVTINRPEVRNAFRPLTVTEMQQAFADARDDPAVGVIIGAKASNSSNPASQPSSSSYRHPARSGE